MNVLYWGHRDNTPISYFRASQFTPYMAEHGVDARYLTLADLAVEAIDWADVVVFRAWYTPDGVTERAWDHAAGRAARIYDTDDWDLETPSYFPHYAEISGQADLIRRMAREADLVTVATPALAFRYASFSRRAPVVVRNAVDMTLYEPDQAKPDGPVTALFYGPNGRLADYFGYVDESGTHHRSYAADAVKGAGIRVMWIGCEGPKAPRDFDIVIPYDWDMRRFFRSLGNSHADIGLAPLIDTAFNACKSELHWLDYTAAGIPVIAQRFMERGPYDVIRDGVDGLMARGAGDWREAVKRLAREPSLRTDLVAAARERMTADYHPRQRAGEWAEAFASALD